MTRLKILNIEPKGYSREAYGIISLIGEVDELILDRTGLLDEVSGYDVLITRLGHRIDAELLEVADKLKVIVSATTGLNHIDLETAEARGIKVLSLKGETEFLRGITATAELAWGLLLSLLRRIPAAIEDVKQGNWERDLYVGRELRGKRLGIVGAGRLGRMMASYATAFGMPVSGYDPYVEIWPVDIKRVNALDILFAESDIVSLHVALTDETRGMIDAVILKQLPAGAVLINTSRGEVIDEEALLCALTAETGLAGAALDVVCGETRGGPPQSQLIEHARQHDNLLISPHIGGATRESMENTEIFMAKKLAGHIGNKPLLKKMKC